MFGSEQLMYNTGGGSFYDYPISGSTRFDSTGNAYLATSYGSATSYYTGTVSFWVKRGKLGGPQEMMSSYSGGHPNSFDIMFTSDDRILVYGGGSSTYAHYTNALYRDVGAWYHIVVACDYANSTASERLKLYVNGTQVTSWYSQSIPAQNNGLMLNWDGGNHRIGTNWNNTGAYFDGYLAEIYKVDGQSLDASNFGEFKSGVWIPKEYTGTYGNNGYHLDCGVNPSTDISGNNNNWTNYTITAHDLMLDSPTNNFPTGNPLTNGPLNWLSQNGNVVSSEGNLRADTDNNGAMLDCTMALPRTGKWYWETMCQNVMWAGMRDLSAIPNGGVTYYYYVSTSSTYGGVNYCPPTSTSGWVLQGEASSGDPIIGCAYDADAGTFKLYKDNVLRYTFGSVPEADYVPNVGGGAANTAILNFGQDSAFAGSRTPQGNTDANGTGDFYYAPPAGYLALCTANLPEPAISPLNGESPQDYFKPIVYSGNGANTTHGNSVSVGFTPDLVWVKNRGTAGENWGAYDVLRGDLGATLYPNLTEAEAGGYHTYLEPSSDGFYLNTNNQNVSGYSYGSLNWKAGGAGVANTDGSITSTVSANVDAGVSVVSYIGNGTNGATVGHGLNSKPQWIFVKDRGNSINWNSYHEPLGQQFLVLNNTAAAAGGSDWPSMSDTTFGLANFNESNGSGRNYVAYCFHSVEGFSKFGQFVGNGSNDGPFIYTGFRPSHVLVKYVSGSQDWTAFDEARDPYNYANHYLHPSAAQAEATYDTIGVDLLSNGFKPRTAYNHLNASGGTYIYMAFAENPFKYANAR